MANMAPTPMAVALDRQRWRDDAGCARSYLGVGGLRRYLQDLDATLDEFDAKENHPHKRHRVEGRALACDRGDCRADL